MELSSLDLPRPAVPSPFVLAPLAPPGLSLRTATRTDIPFLRELYGDLRAQELGGVPWPGSLKQRFLDQQFALQHRHYTARFGNGDFLVVEQAGHAVGRLYLDRNGCEWQLVDIGLLASVRGQGLGTALIRLVQSLAREQGAAVRLHLRLDNGRARALYQRLGFEAGAAGGLHLAMRWTAGGTVS